jgi:hypothetical protein
MGALAAAERRLAASGRADGLHAESGPFARLLAGMAAAAAQQAVYLAAAERRR